jgi:hypothetical protein
MSISTELSAISQMNLLRRCRHWTPVAVNKANSAGEKNHLAFHHTSVRLAGQVRHFPARNPMAVS